MFNDDLSHFCLEEPLCVFPHFAKVNQSYFVIIILINNQRTFLNVFFWGTGMNNVLLLIKFIK